MAIFRTIKKSKRLLSAIVILFIIILYVFNERNKIRKRRNHFESIIDTYCQVKSVNNAYDCLLKLRKYDLSVDYSYSNVTNSNRVVYHTFWKLNSSYINHVRVMIFKIYSFLATQDLTKTKLILWTNLQYDESLRQILNQKFQFFMHSDLIEIKLLNLESLCSNGVFKAYYKSCIKTFDSDIKNFSNFVRFLILYNYFGVYTDGDVLFLKDMRPFWFQNFAYSAPSNQDYSTNVLGLRRDRNIENVYREILSGYNGDESKFCQIFQSDSTKKALNAYFNIYHSVLFDPAWTCNDGFASRKDPTSICTFKEFYSIPIKSENIDFFDGAYTHDLHFNDRDHNIIDKNSYFSRLEAQFENRAQIKLDKLRRTF